MAKTIKRIKLACGCILPRRDNHCAYCGSGWDDGKVCGVCKDGGVGSKVIRGTEARKCQAHGGKPKIKVGKGVVVKAKMTRPSDNPYRELYQTWWDVAERLEGVIHPENLPDSAEELSSNRARKMLKQAEELVVQTAEMFRELAYLEENTQRSKSKTKG